MGTFWTPSAYIHRSLHKAIEYAAELSLCSCLRPLGETAARTVRLSPSRPGGEGCHEGIGDRHIDPDYPCLSANQREFLPSCPCWTTMGEYSQASVLSEHWPGNSAIRCRVRGLGHTSRHLTLHWAEVRTLHFFPGRGCTHSAQFTLSQSGGLSTPGSALLPNGFGRCGQVLPPKLYCLKSLARRA